MTLPEDMLENASIENEIGWKRNNFQTILRRARQHGLACLGGQFQFRFEDGTCEMYWLDADSTERKSDESWQNYVQRSLDEVSHNFSRLCATANFEREIDNWEFVRMKREQGIDPMQYLWFVADFLTEDEYNELDKASNEIRSRYKPLP